MRTPAIASVQRAGVAERHAGSARMAQRVVVPSRAACRPRVSVEASRASLRRRQLPRGQNYSMNAKSEDVEASPASSEAEEVVQPVAGEGEDEEFDSSDDSDLDYELGGETFEGSLDGSGLRVGIVVARFNELVTRPLLEGAKSALERHWVDVDNDVDVAWVPGAFELPLVAKAMAKSGKYDAVIAIGTVVRGSTGHYDAVVGGATSGVLGASVDTGVPVVFNVLTCDTMEQALDRAGGKSGNKGAESAATAVEMANLLASMREEGVAADPW